MRIILITTMTPTSENIRGTSALPYHLIKGGSPTPSLPEGEGNIAHNFSIYTFNNNALSDEKIAQVEKELNVKIYKVPLPKWFTFVFKYHLLFIRLFLKYPIHHYVKLPTKYVEEIKAKKPDLIWIYGAEWSKVVNQFDGYKRLHTLPDSEALYYYRMLGQRFVTHDWKKFWRCALMYPKFLALERNYSTEHTIHYHLVGEEDVKFLKKMNPGIQAHFIRHPHYEISQKLKAESGKLEVSFHSPKIRVLIAGRYDLYMKQEADLLIKSLTPAPSPKEKGIEDFLQKHYSFTFLGKGWEKHVETLRSAGYEVEHIKFAPDYIEEICKHDIQITPISIGTGTKGKVLDALANGLLVIGTPYALENIAVKHGESCIEYRTPQEVIEVLKDIPQNMRKYEDIALAGRNAILKYHGRAVVSQTLFGIFKEMFSVK